MKRALSSKGKPRPSLPGLIAQLYADSTQRNAHTDAAYPDLIKDSFVTVHRLVRPTIRDGVDRSDGSESLVLYII